MVISNSSSSSITSSTMSSESAPMSSVKEVLSVTCSLFTPRLSQTIWMTFSLISSRLFTTHPPKADRYKRRHDLFCAWGKALSPSQPAALTETAHGISTYVPYAVVNRQDISGLARIPPPTDKTQVPPAAMLLSYYFDCFAKRQCCHMGFFGRSA